MKTTRLRIAAALALWGQAECFSQPSVWTGNGDGTSWTNAQNWASLHAPGPTNTVFITNGVGGNVVLSAAVSVESVVCAPALTISNGSLTVTLGTSSLAGVLTIASGSSLSASGSNTTFTASGLVSADDANFSVSGGAAMSLAGLQNYTKQCNGANWTVTGTNSVLNLPGLTNITGAPCNYPTIQAQAGGQILATNLASIQAGPLTFQADGPNSLINLSGLTTCAGQSPYLVTFEASGGGTVEIPNMTGGPLVGLILNPGGNIPTAQIRTLAGLTLNGVTANFPALANATGTITVSGVAASFPALTNFYDGNLVVSGGAAVTFPTLQNYAKNCNGAYWTVTGSNSVLNLPVLTNITGAPCNYPAIQAQAGGQIFATNLASIQAGPLAFQADGANSLINLSGLTTCAGQSPYLVTFEASGGGTVEIPNMTGSPFVGLILNPGENIPTAQIRTLAGLTLNGVTASFPALANATGTITVSGVAASFPALTNFYDGNLTVSGGAVVSLPALQNYAKGCNGAYWTVTGSNSVLNLPALTNITGSPCNYPAIQAEAGGQILATNLASIQAGPLAFQADGTGSLIDLSGLVTCSGQAGYLVTFEASSAGTLRVPNLAGGPLVGVTIYPNATLPLSAIRQLTSITLNGGAVTFPALTNVYGGTITLNSGTASFPALTSLTGTALAANGVSVSFPALTNCDGANLSASAGAVVELPAVGSYQAGCANVTWQATGAGSVLAFAGLASLQGATCGGTLSLQASSGGQVLLTNVALIPADSVTAQAQGTNSVIALSRLTANAGTFNVSASGGGSVLLPELANGGVVNLALSPGGFISTAQLTNIDGANLYVSGGAVLSLPGVTSYRAGCANVTWEASGAGSILQLAGLTTLQGASCGGTLSIQALSGGQVLLSNVATIPSNSVSVQAQGTGSIVSLSGLITSSGLLNLSASEGGSVLLSALANGGEVNFNLVPGGVISTPQLTNINGANLSVSGGATLSLPGVVSYQAGCANVTWQASGAGSVLELPGLTSLQGASCGGSLSMQALSGGQVLLTNVLTVPAGTVSVQAQGSNSLVAVTMLTTNTGLLNVSASGGGSVSLPDLANGGVANLALAAGGFISTAQFTNINGANLSVSGGATLSLPAVTSYQAGCANVTWQANGAGSVLELPGLTILQGASCGGTLNLQALAGGEMLLSNVLTIPGYTIAAAAQGSNSLVALTMLATNAGLLNLSASGGGSVLMSDLAKGGAINLALAGPSFISTAQLTNIDGANLSVSGGAALSLPAVLSYQAGCANITWQASGAGSVLDLPGLTSLQGASCGGTLNIQALSGGQVLLDHLGAIPAGTVAARADGANSVVNVSSLIHYQPASTSLIGTNGGVILLSGPLLSITANNASMTYGGAVPAFSVSYSGFLNGDTPASLTHAPSISATATSLSHAGTYPITVSGAVDTNYTIVYTPGTLTINPAPLTIVASNASKTYGQTATVPGTAFNSVGLLNGDTIAGVTFASLGLAPTAGMGVYPLTPANASGPRAGNYSITYSNGTLTVNPATLSITASNATKYQGNTLSFVGTEFSAGGLQNGDTVGSVTLTSPGAAAAATVAGSPYPIVPSAATGGSFAPANYTIHYFNGSLTVLPVGTPPTIASVSPSAGPNTGGSTVTIGGTGFEPGAAVTFGSLPATSVLFASSNLLTAVTPLSPSGTVGVSISNPDGHHVTAPNAFAFGNAPGFTASPTNLTLLPGQTAHFSVQASGDPALTYQWQYNGANLLGSGRITGVNTPALAITGVGTGDDGYYRCVVTNLYASVTSAAAVLSVVTPPSTVVVSPPGAAVGFGSSVSFTATADGTPPLAYSWYQNGGLLAGQTAAVLDLLNVQTNGTYTVVVTNAAGSVTSAPVSLTLLGYCINGQSTRSTYPEGTNFIPINVVTYNCGTGTAVPGSAGVVWLTIDGTSRNLTVTTDGSGHGTAYFTPLPVEVGFVQYGFGLPGQAQPAAVGSFTIIGMNLSAQSQSPHLVVGIPQTHTLLLNNLTAVPLSGITATVLGAPPNVSVQVSVPSSLAGNGAVQTTYTVEATGTIPAQAQFSIQYTSAEGATVTLPFTATMSPPTAQFATLPPSLVGAMVDGSQTLVSFTLTNFGGAPSGPIQVDLPPVPWLSTVTAQPLPSLAPGQSGQVMLALTPTNGQQLGEYPGNLVVQGSNTSLSVPFVFTAVSSLKGNLQVTVQDELSVYGAGNPNLSNATVTVSDFLTGTVVGTQVTGPSGIVTFSNLTSAYYTISAQAADHGSFGTTLLVAANTTTPVTAFLALNLVDYTWTVTPTTIPDTYFFTLTTVFVTEVPWPVVSVSPIDLCSLPNCTNQYDLVITNAGLIAAEGLQIVINNANPYWSFVALVTNLGNLAAESSITVPIVLTRLGCATNAGGPTSIEASLNWYVAALNGTEYYSTPIFIYNANCVPGNAGTPPVGYVGGGGGGTAGVTQPVNYTFSPTPGAVVNVTLQIDQTAVLTANAFHATLSLTNDSGAPITGLQVTISPVNTNGTPATNAFFIQPPLLSGLNAVDGTGSLAVNTGGQANWTIVPTTNAAPLGQTSYGLGGSISYVLNGEPVTIPLFAVPITVLPEPLLALDYFLQHDVYSQDPFTTVVEPPIPFALGLQVRNLGQGVADDFTITSAQPTIINNANGLLIDFEIISSDVGTNATPVPSLTLNLGDIDPGTNVVGIWWLTSSLEGSFTNFLATFQHLDALGGQETSLVNSVRIHELNHVVQITCPSDDGIPDFLCNDTTNVDAPPNNVYSSDGNVYPVTSLTGAMATGTVVGVNSTITITDAADIIPPGFVYFELPDPSLGQYAITSVRRSDGTALLVGPNVWQTPYRPHMVPPHLANLIRIFDCNSTGSYTVTYGPPIAAPAAATLAAQNLTPTNATLVGTINPEGGSTEYYFEWGSTAGYGNFTRTNWLTANLGAVQAVTAYLGNLSPATTIHYQVVAINSAGTNYGGDQVVGIPALPVPVIVQEANQSLIVGQTLTFTNTAVAATPPATFTLGASAPAGASVTANGVFTWTPTCAQGSTTNVILIWATDSGTPPLSNAMTFVATVSECVQLGVGSAVVHVGQSSDLPVTLVTTVGITNLSFTLAVPAGRFTNFTFTPSDPAIASATVQVTGSSPPVFTLATHPGETLSSPSLLGTVGFTVLPGDSAFLPVTAANIVGSKSDGNGVGNATSLPGRITIVGLHPLLAPARAGQSTVSLTLFGNPGTTYQLAYTTNLASTNWQVVGSILVTNVQQNFNLSPTNPHTYFRLQ